MPIYAFPPPEPVSVPIRGVDDLYPVSRIFCVARNYAAHAAEMGNEVDREAPFYFTKSPRTLRLSGARVPYPPGTADFHHEMELVVALGEGGKPYAYACGLDMTRRDLQAQAKEKRRPWDVAKDFENSAIIGTLCRDFTLGAQGIELAVNGEIRQAAWLREMVWSVPEILAHLGGLYTLGPGDLIFTGTPAGVGPVRPGDVLEGRIGDLPFVRLTIEPPAV